MNLDNQFIPNQTARRSLAKKLNLEFSDSMQDWEYEISDPNRIEEFIKEYDNPTITEKEKQSLMEIMLDSSNDLLLDKKNSKFEKVFPLIFERLSREKELHQASLHYWKVGDFEISDELKNGEI